jgi:hypothetical protein
VRRQKKMAHLCQTSRTVPIHRQECRASPNWVLSTG